MANEFAFSPFKIWRAVRLIVDTGLHYTGMKRDEAIKLFADNAWDDSDFTRKEVRQCFGVERQKQQRLFTIYKGKPVCKRLYK